MKVHLIRKETIEAFAKRSARSRVSFEEWLAKLKYADWEKPTDMSATFAGADLLGKIPGVWFLKSQEILTA